MAEPVLSIAIVGFGYWGPNYARILDGGLPGVRLAGIADRSDGRLAAAAAQHPAVATYRSHVEMLESERPDAVVVTTPTATHRAVAEECLRAGVHVLVEKPLATTTADAEAIDAAARERDRLLMVGHTFIFNPAVRQVKHYIDSGALGRVLYCHFHRTGLGPIRQDVNALWDLAPHDVSMLNYWLGREPVEVNAHGQWYLKPGTQDVVFVTLRYPDSVIASIHVSWLDPIKVRSATVVGDRKMVTFDDTSPSEKLRVYDKGASYQPAGPDYGDFVAAVRDGDILIPQLPQQEPLRAQVSHFAECIRQGTRPLTDGRAGVEVVRVLEAAEAELRRSSEMGSAAR